MTVGEMIAGHHRHAALLRARKDAMDFYNTPIGLALERFESAMARLGQVEAMDYPSDKQLRVCSDRVEQGRDEIRTLLFFQLGKDRRD